MRLEPGTWKTLIQGAGDCIDHCSLIPASCRCVVVVNPWLIRVIAFQSGSKFVIISGWLEG